MAMVKLDALPKWQYGNMRDYVSESQAYSSSLGWIHEFIENWSLCLKIRIIKKTKKKKKRRKG